ncbi:esterase-like activity of phytase family protein [Pontiella agarivorans]|uniref:Esterase-like activity of phytase family protein n=1 Tax=Pontiella agarivorans TaxID=3038953 RepID=A0ABU5MYW6_9BACT|nr:esterase-like activity of phytase family protein [Pontiella agarivorans]MDZ8119354.1 esterase-like activity of phytase family protein [Pontiella agarivorans]
MNKLTLAAAGLVAVSAANSALARRHYCKTGKLFQHVASFDVMAGNGSAVAEITDATKDGKQLVYTDGENKAIGFVNIANPAVPMGEGSVNVGGEPTSLVILDDLVLVGVNTSDDYASPSGKLVVIDRISHNILAERELGGQPDSLALSPDHRYAAIVIENERDEDLNDGFIPQNKTGALLIVDLVGEADDWNIRAADLSPVAAHAYAGPDLEPEYVDINTQNEAVVTFQENNHLAVIDLATGDILNEFSCGSVELSNVDTEEEGLIAFTDTITKRREPDAVTWIDHDSFATANEGDYEDENGEGGGSRGFTIFNQNGTVEYESAESFEHWLASAGHYNEDRSGNKGCEPEAVEFGTFEGRNFLFVGSERANAIGVYSISRNGRLTAEQLLPTGIGPEGLKVIEKRGLFVASTEKDEEEAGIPTMINIYQLRRGPAFYPTIQSVNDENGAPIPWVALSGLTADCWNPNRLYAVSDSFLSEGFIYTIKANTHPAQIVNRIPVTGASCGLDLEGISKGWDGSFWLASEGNADDLPNMILKVDRNGSVLNEILLPDFLEEHARKNGFEGIAVTGWPGREIVYVAIQRAWPNTGDIDKKHTKIGRYDVAKDEWSFVYYPLEAESDGGWIGLSELTHIAGNWFAVIERDKGWGPSTGLNAELKSVYAVRLSKNDFKPYTETLKTVRKYELADLQPALDASSIWTTEKLEGLAINRFGRIYVVSDNDGVDEAPGETLFLRIR